MDIPDPSIDQPEGITAGPDGALWFANAGNNSIGRISTSVVVANYTDPSIDQPENITSGPDGALRFTDAGNNSMGASRSRVRFPTTPILRSTSPKASASGLTKNCGSPMRATTP